MINSIEEVLYIPRRRRKLKAPYGGELRYVLMNVIYTLFHVPQKSQAYHLCP